jgi:hypothetical protein
MMHRCIVQTANITITGGILEYTPTTYQPSNLTSKNKNSRPRVREFYKTDARL